MPFFSISKSCHNLRRKTHFAEKSHFSTFFKFYYSEITDKIPHTRPPRSGKLNKIQHKIIAFISTKLFSRYVKKGIIFYSATTQHTNLQIDNYNKCSANNLTKFPIFFYLHNRICKLHKAIHNPYSTR